MNPRRRTGLAGVVASADSAGTIASSSGSAMVTPMPRRNVRRGSEIFEMNIAFSSFSTISALPQRSTRSRDRGRGRPGLLTLCATHLERRARRDADDERLEAVGASSRVLHNFPDGGRVVVLDAAAERIDQ